MQIIRKCRMQTGPSNYKRKCVTCIANYDRCKICLEIIQNIFLFCLKETCLLCVCFVFCLSLCAILLLSNTYNFWFFNTNVIVNCISTNKFGDNTIFRQFYMQ